MTWRQATHKTSVRPATADDVDTMVALLHAQMNSRFSRERWRRLFDYSWCPERPDFGRVAFLNGELVGCCAAVYADRAINGARHRIVNPCAWYLDRRARGSGLGMKLMADLVAHPEWTAQISSSSKLTTGLLDRIGFQVLDTHKFVWTSSNAHVANTSPPPITLLTDRTNIATRLAPDDRQKLNDHDATFTTPILVSMENGQEIFLLVRDCIKSGDERWLDVMFVSDADLLARHGQTIANKMSSAGNPVRLAIDERLCPNGGHTAERLAIDPPRYWKPAPGVAAGAVDHLYTEVPLLGLKLA